MKILKILALVVGVFVIAIACGGGSGGGGNDSGGGISYSGSTIKATINDSNAEDVSTGAYQVGTTGSALSVIGAIETYEDNQITRPRSLVVSQALGNALSKVDISSHSGGIASASVQSESDRIYGDCGGHADVTVTYDDVTGNFNGSMNFNGFCSGSVFISGSTSFSGTLDVGTGDFIDFTFSFNSLTGSSGSDSFTLQGELSVNASTSLVTATMNMLLKDNTSGNVYKLENYVMTTTEGSTYIDIEVSGKYYDPAYGYVDISTPSPLRIFDTDDWPSQGLMVLTGNTGMGGGSTKAKLTALSSTQYQVEADTNGDGTYDYNSGPLNWSDL